MLNLINDMRSIGILINDTPTLDGKPHRLPVDGKKSTRKNGWYRGNIVNDKIYCKFGRWDTGEVIKWRENGHNPISPDDIKIMQMIAERDKQEKLRLQEKAKKSAQAIWALSTTPSGHTYLENKKINPHIARQYKDRLIIPMYNSQGELVNIQRIYPDGDKKFLYGGEVIGCAAKIPGNDKICICEGFATGASIAEATGFSVIVSFNANNLIPVSKSVRDKNPIAEIIICADNDLKGAGERYAKIASESILSNYRVPPIVGTDFNDLACSGGLSAVKNAICKSNSELEIMDGNDIESEYDLTLNIPKEIYQVAGLISDGLEACIESGSPEIIQYNFPVVISIIARAIAGKLSCQGVYPALYNIKIGGTSTGKTDIDKAFKTAILRTNMASFYGPTDFSSGPGLLRGIMNGCEKSLIVMDEVTYLFRRISDDINGAGKMAALLELYTASGQEIKRPYADKGQNIHIVNPVVIMTGNATPNLFEDIRIEDLTSGLIQRMDFFTYMGKIPYRKPQKDDSSAMQKFIEGIRALFTAVAPQANTHDISGIISNFRLKLSKDCAERIEKLSIDITDAANNIIDDDSVKGIISRKYHLAIKYAMIHAASTRSSGKIFDPLQENNIVWGIAVADMISDWKINKLVQKVTSGGFHRDCEIFKDAIKAAIRSGQKPSIKVISAKKRRIKELRPKELNDIISALSRRGEIIVDDSGRNTLYYLAKQEGRY